MHITKTSICSIVQPVSKGNYEYAYVEHLSPFLGTCSMQEMSVNLNVKYR